jgi:hypothetical protein
MYIPQPGEWETDKSFIGGQSMLLGICFKGYHQF